MPSLPRKLSIRPPAGREKGVIPPFSVQPRSLGTIANVLGAQGVAYKIAVKASAFKTGFDSKKRLTSQFVPLANICQVAVSVEAVKLKARVLWTASLTHGSLGILIRERVSPLTFNLRSSDENSATGIGTRTAQRLRCF